MQKNPWTVRGHIARCWLFTYQTPLETAKRLLPPRLEPITQGEVAFWNIVVCRLEAMRPAPFPAFVGLGYRHVAYRLYARLPMPDGSAIEGLYFLRSDCDNPLMTALGNQLTDFHFHTASIQMKEEDTKVELNIQSPDAPAQALLNRNAAPALPAYSAFSSLEEASARLKYSPFGISINKSGEANVVRIVRDETAWRSRVVVVESAEWAFFKGIPVQPELCFEVEPIHYQWNRGQIYPPLS